MKSDPVTLEWWLFLVNYAGLDAGHHTTSSWLDRHGKKAEVSYTLPVPGT